MPSRIVGYEQSIKVELQYLLDRHSIATSDERTRSGFRYGGISKHFKKGTGNARLFPILKPLRPNIRHRTPVMPENSRSPCLCVIV